MAAITICSDFVTPKKIKSDTVSTVSPSIFYEVMGPDAMILFFWMLSQLFHSPLTFIKNLFSCSSLSAIRVVSSAYLRLLIFLPAILILVCVSSSLEFCMMYSAYKLIWIPFISFYSLIAMARASETMSNKSGKSGHLCLVPVFEEMLSSFHCWGWC